ncbi:MAG TPA: aconitate hydratase [Candidatus Marinimicrobia bacterium]|nr:aconitate hydratase [Candidatus Neomarinimicrobiota bacterium]
MDYIAVVSDFYSKFARQIARLKNILKRPLTLTEKILFAHLDNPDSICNIKRQKSYIELKPDRVAMQDATGQMALLQLMNSGIQQVQVPTTLHCDHLICAASGAEEDLQQALADNGEVYRFLENAAAKFGIGFWEPGSGIIHQIVLENYAFPGGLIIGTDSHTPTAGGLGMLGVGVGGADVVDVMAGLSWELKMPAVIGVELVGQLKNWVSAKDVILKLAGIIGTKGATDAVIEYFGAGTQNISCTGKATICNMGAELGATTSVFHHDDRMNDFLVYTGRERLIPVIKKVAPELCTDPAVCADPEKFYDRVIRIDLNTLEPYINGPFTPDLAVPISEFAGYIEKNAYPTCWSAGLIGSCTNSSYEDLARAAAVARQANRARISPKARLFINPGSEQVRQVCDRTGLMDEFRRLGAVLLANACGPCIGQWRRQPKPGQTNSIITSFNRNFAGRNDGNPRTHAFIASPEIVIAMVLAGDLRFNPLTDFLDGADGQKVRLAPPESTDLPKIRIRCDTRRDINTGDPTVKITIRADSERLQLLQPFPEWDEKSFRDLELLIKVRGRCTTDHISPAGKWLKYRGHLDRISDNLLKGARNAFYPENGKSFNRFSGEFDEIARVARDYQARGKQMVIVGDENYGEGSSREHAAMEPRHLGVVMVIAKSFARIHETNLKKQGILAVTFENPTDYDHIRADDQMDIPGLENFSPNSRLNLILKHRDGSQQTIRLRHSYNRQQIQWFKAGSAMNFIRKQKGQKHV